MRRRATAHLAAPRCAPPDRQRSSTRQIDFAGRRRLPLDAGPLAWRSDYLSNWHVMVVQTGSRWKGKHVSQLLRNGEKTSWDEAAAFDAKGAEATKETGPSAHWTEFGHQGQVSSQSGSSTSDYFLATLRAIFGGNWH